MEKPKKTFDAVAFMRQQRIQLSEKLSKMTKAEIVAYFQKEKLGLGAKTYIQKTGS